MNAVVNVAAPPVVTGRTLAAGTVNNQGGALTNTGFMATIMQILSGFNPDVENAFIEVMTPEEDTEKINLQAMEILANALSIPVAELQTLLNELNVSVGEFSKIMNNPVVQQLIKEKQDVQKQEVKPQDMADDLKMEVDTGKNLQVVKSIIAENSGKSGKEDLFNNQLTGESSFKNAVSAAMKMMKSGKQPEQPSEVNVEAIQTAVDTGKFTMSSVVAAAKLDTQTVDSKDVMKQVENGIKANLGKDEFIIKLKPEGLGEVTIKMVTQNSKIMLNIVTSNVNTERIISNELNSLRDSLKSLNAEVETVTTQSEAYFGADHNSGSRHEQMMNRHRFNNANGDFEEELTPEVMELLTELDRYI